MEEKLKELIKELYSGENLVQVYKQLLKIFEKEGLYLEQASILEKLWHITRKHDLYKKIGDIYYSQKPNRELALKAYNRYLQYTMPEFFKSYADNLYQMGEKRFKLEDEKDDLTSEKVLLSDRYVAIINTMVCMCKKGYYDSVLEMSDCLLKIKEKLKFLPPHDEIFIELKNSDKYLSDLLINSNQANSINEFVIQFSPKNQQAYFKIIEDYIENRKYKEAINFYNNCYVKEFSLREKFNDISSVCWAVSWFYKSKYKFYNAVKFQKYALELALSEGVV